MILKKFLVLHLSYAVTRSVSKQIENEIKIAHDNKIRSNNSENELKSSYSTQITTSDFNLLGADILFSREQLIREQHEDGEISNLFARSIDSDAVAHNVISFY